MEAICHTPKEMKSKSFDKIKKEKMRKGHVARRKVRGNFPLESSWIDLVGGREKGGKGKERKENKEEGKWSEKLCNTPIFRGPVNHRQPTETYMSHIMRPYMSKMTQ